MRTKIEPARSATTARTIDDWRPQTPKAARGNGQEGRVYSSDETLATDECNSDVPPVSGNVGPGNDNGKSVFSKWRDRIRESANAMWRYLQDVFKRLRYNLRQLATWLNEHATRKWAVAGLVLFLLIVAFSAVFSKSSTKANVAQLVVSEWLNAQLAGGTGTEFMAPSPEAPRVHFHSLRSWRFQSEPTPETFLVEITAERPDGTTAVAPCWVTVGHGIAENARLGPKVVRVDFNPPQK
jgi:hypothetical protein